MAQRFTFAGCLSGFGTGILRFVNLLILLGACATVAIFFVIKNIPTFPEGWGFIALGGVTIFSGIFGLSSRPGEFGWLGLHLVFALLSSAGLAIAFFVIFIDRSMVLHHVRYDGRDRSEKLTLLTVCGAIFFVLFCLQLSVFMLNCMIRFCNFYDYYEDLEAAEPSAKQLTKERKKEEKQRAKIGATSASQLAEKMKSKYGQYSSDPIYNKT